MNPSVDDIEQIRIVLAGDSGVGKTSLIGQFLGIGFQADLFCPTVGANVEKRRMNIRGQDISVQIIDTCGQERFRAIPPMHFREAAGVILVYDIRRPESFKNIYRWLWMVKDHAPEDASILLVGNKADLESERAVSTEEGETLANERQLRFLETSATDKDNVDWAFARLLTDICDRVRRGDATYSMPGVKFARRPKEGTLGIEHHSASTMGGCYC